MALNSLGLGLTLTADNQTSGGFQAAADSLDKAMGRYSKAGAELAATGEAMKDVGTKMAGVGLAGLAGLGVAANAAAEYGKQVGLVQTIASQAEFPLERIKDIGYEFAGAYGGDATGQLKALYNALSSGASTAAESTALLTQANLLAVSGNTTVEASMAGLTGTLNAYGMQMSEATTVADSFFTAVKLGAADMSVEVLSKQLSGVSATANTLGVGMNETLAGLSRLTASGTSTSQAVTELKAVLTAVMQPSKDAASEAKRLGISFDMAALKSKGLQGMLDAIGASGKQTPETMKKLFGASVEAFSGISKLYGDGGAQFRDFNAQMNKSGGAAKAAFDIMGGKEAFSAAQLLGNLKTAAILVGDVVLPVFGAIGAAINRVVVAFNTMPQPIRTAIVMGFMMASVGLVLAGGLMVAAGAVVALAGVAEAMAIAVMIGVGAFQAIGAAVLVASGVFAIFKTAYDRDLGGFGTTLRQAYTSAKLAVEGLQQLFSSGALSGSVMQELDKAENAGLFSFIKTIYLWGNQAGNFFRAAGEEIRRGLDTMAPAFEEISGLLRTIGAAFGLVAPDAQQAASAFDRAGEAGATFGSFVTAGIEIVVDVVRGLVGWTAGLVTGFRQATAGAGPLTALGPALSATLNAVTAALDSLTGGTKNASSGAESVGLTMGRVFGGVVMVIATVANVATSVFSVVVGAVGAVISVVQGLIGIFSGVFNILGGLVSMNGAMMWMGFKQVALGAITAIVGALLGMLSVVGAVADGVGKIFGKDLGIQKGAEALKGSAISGLTKSFGLNKTDTTVMPAPPPPAGMAPALSPGGGDRGPALSTAPIFPGTGAGPMPAVAGATASGAAAGGVADLAAAIKATPPPAVTTNLNVQAVVNEGVLFDVVQRVGGDTNGRSFGPSPTAT